MHQPELNLFPEESAAIRPPMTQGQAYWLKRMTGRDFTACHPQPSAEAASRLLSSLFAWSKAETACNCEMASAWRNRVERDIRRDYFPDFTYYELNP